MTRTGMLFLLPVLCACVVAGVAKAWLFFSVVQPGLRERGVSVDDGRLALRGSFGHYTRAYLALLSDAEQRQPCNRWLRWLQWLLPLLIATAVASGILFSLRAEP